MKHRPARLCDPWHKLFDQPAFADTCFATHKRSAQPRRSVCTVPERHDPVDLDRTTNKWKNAVIEKIY
jgi:hypothetical protein